MQKGYTPNYLTHKRVINNGEVQQYYVKEHHEVIISPEVFDKVQALIATRTAAKGRYAFSGKIKCGEYVGTYVRKTLNSNRKYRKVVWGCNHRFETEHQVSFLEIPQIEYAFTKSVCGFLEKKGEVAAVIEEKAIGVLKMEDKADLEN